MTLRSRLIPQGRVATAKRKVRQIMFEQILVPLDGTKRGAEAIEIASRLAGRFGAQLILLRVEDVAASTDQLLADNLDLERRTAELRLRGLRARHAIEFGRPEQKIAELAQSSSARLIVLAPHHRSLMEVLRAPSVTARLLGHLSTPLLIWPERAPGRVLEHLLNVPRAQVIVPLDGSALAEQALPSALEFAGSYARPLLLVRVIPTQPQAAIWPETFGAQIYLEMDAEHDAETYLTRMCAQLEAEQPGLMVRSTVLLGRPDREIERCAQGHDGSLVVMSTHGRGGIQRALLGSVAAQLARESTPPLLIVPPQAHHRAQVNVPADLAVTVSEP
jgi:nucleotide-binding universal stress UspA family protein